MYVLMTYIHSGDVKMFREIRTARPGISLACERAIANWTRAPAFKR